MNAPPTHFGVKVERLFAHFDAKTRGVGGG